MLKVERENQDKDFRGTAVVFMPDIPARTLSVHENTQIIERWKLKIMTKVFLQQRCISLYIWIQNTEHEK